MRALANFTVKAEGIAVRVRLMATEVDVIASARADRVHKHRDTRAYFLPAGPGAATVGTIVMPVVGATIELAAHECSHAVIEGLRGVHVDDDERAATAIGLLTAKIHERIRKLQGAS